MWIKLALGAVLAMVLVLSLARIKVFGASSPESV